MVISVDASMIMDFHGDGHPSDLTDLRLDELDAYFRTLKAQSDPEFLLIPAEEANVHLGGHWSLVFPKPVYWFMNRPKDKNAAFEMQHPKYGKVYSTANAQEMLELVRRTGWIAFLKTPVRVEGHPLARRIGLRQRGRGQSGNQESHRDHEEFHE